MNVQKRVRKNLSVGLVAGFLFVAGLSAALGPNPQAVDADSGLQITIHLDPEEDGRSEGPKFNVELRNTGVNDLILNLGTMLANGKKQYLDKLVLFLKDGQGKSRSMIDVRGPFSIAGRVDPLVVPLCAGCAFSFPVDLNNYMYLEEQTKDYAVVLNPGAYSIEARFIGEGINHGPAAELMPYWIGSLSSNQLRFETFKPIATRHPN